MTRNVRVFSLFFWFFFCCVFSIPCNQEHVQKGYIGFVEMCATEGIMFEPKYIYIFLIGTCYCAPLSISVLLCYR